jgi:hypothetical protein
LGEAAAITVGVFLSLWADQWRQDRSAAEEGRASLVRIVVELANDTVQMMELADQANHGVAAIDSILNADPRSDATPALLARTIPWVMQSSIFDPGFAEFDALRSSGRLGLITDSEILNRLTRYASTLQSVATMQNLDLAQAHAAAQLMYPDIEMPRSQFVSGLSQGPRFPAPDVAPTATDLLLDPVFVNEMTYLGYLRTIHRAITRSAATQASELLEVIHQRLNE